MHPANWLTVWLTIGIRLVKPLTSHWQGRVESWNLSWSPVIFTWFCVARMWIIDTIFHTWRENKCLEPEFKAASLRIAIFKSHVSNSLFRFKHFSFPCPHFISRCEDVDGFFTAGRTSFAGSRWRKFMHQWTVLIHRRGCGAELGRFVCRRSLNEQSAVRSN